MIQNGIEIDGEILPDNMGVNQPRYYESTRDTEIPHDMTGEADVVGLYRRQARQQVQAAIPEGHRPKIREHNGETATFVAQRIEASEG